MRGKHSIGALLQARQRAAEDGVFLQRARKRERTLNASDDILCKRLRNDRIGACPNQRAVKRLDPTLEIKSDRLGEAIPCLIQREGSKQANPAAGAKITVNRPPHLRDRGTRLIALQWFKHFAHEPSVDIGQNFRRHAFLPLGKEVIEAALRQASALGDFKQSRALEAEFAKDLGHPCDRVAFLENRARHVLSVSPRQFWFYSPRSDRPG